MSFDSADERDLARLRDFNPEVQRFESSPRGKQRLGWFTVMCFIFNRTIGTGVFVTPSKIILGTGNVGPALVLWVFGGVVAMAGLHTWLEFGLSVPRRIEPESGDEKSVPYSGGEKNYFEFLFPSPKFMTTCMFGIVFIILGNLTGNAIQLGIYAMAAAGYDNPSKGSVLGIAIAVLSFVVCFHAFSRRGGIT